MDQLSREIAAVMEAHACANGVDIDGGKLLKGVLLQMAAARSVLSEATIRSFEPKDWAITLSQCGKQGISVSALVMLAITKMHNQCGQMAFEASGKLVPKKRRPKLTIVT